MRTFAFLTSFKKTSCRFTARVRPTRLICAATLWGILAAPAFALNIVWVSHNGTSGFSGPVAGFAEDAFITNLLQTAGHNVIRFFPANNANTALTAEQLAALNTNDLIIASRSINSGAFAQPGVQGPQWNTAVTKPLIMMSAYLIRANRLGWASGDTVTPDNVSTAVAATDLNDPAIAYIFKDVAMSGTNTVNAYNEPIDQNTSLLVSAPVAGGRVLARSLTAPIGASIITEWPAGTAVRGGADVLGGYRMFFGGGSREAAGGTVPTAGKENLTADTGEILFLRAVELAANNGVPPNIVHEPIIIATEPADRTVDENDSATLAVTLTQGTQPRYQWYFNDAPIPGATLSTLGLGSLAPSNSGPYYVVITNPVSVVTSMVATVTVTPDTNPPTVVSARAVSLNTIHLIFSEPVDRVTAEDLNAYTFEQPNDVLFPSSVMLTNSTTVVITVTPGLQADQEYLAVAVGVTDRSVAANVLDPNFASVPLQMPGTARGNIVWVSDNPATLGFSGPIAQTEDDAFVTNFLQSAGYNVIRYNSDNSNTNLISSADIEALNTNDLIIIGRSTGSAAFQAGQGSQWNTNITIPIVVMSSYLVRTAQLSWFTGGTLPDNPQSRLVVTNLNNPATAYIFEDVAMRGNSTVDFYNHPLDQNTSMITDPPVAGGVIIASASEQSGATAIAEFPEGTAVRGGTEVLAGYRMFFAGGSRELTGGVPAAGKDNLTPTGESIFLRAIAVAMNEGGVPGTGGGEQQPIGNPTFTNGTFSASILTQTGVSYEVQYKDDLNATSWTTLTTITGDGTAQSFTDATPSVAGRFYRVVIP